jgi:uncharacterized protein YodC (DUF2158 family)
MKVSDVVKLKSGSPPMTIERIDDQEIAQCVWFDERKKLERAFFPTAILVLYTPPSGSAFTIKTIT